MCTYKAFFKNVLLHVYAMLHPSGDEHDQAYIFTLVPFEDCTIPLLDDIARNIVIHSFTQSTWAVKVTIDCLRGKSTKKRDVKEAPRMRRPVLMTNQVKIVIVTSQMIMIVEMPMGTSQVTVIVETTTVNIPLHVI